MINWRKWLLLVSAVIFIGLIFLSDRIASVVVHAVGVATIHTHPVLTVVFSIGIGVMLGSMCALCILLDVTGKTHISKASTVLAIAFLIIAALYLLKVWNEIVIFFSRLHSSDLIFNISRLFRYSVVIGYFLLGGLLQLILIYRKKQAQMASTTPERLL